MKPLKVIEVFRKKTKGGGHAEVHLIVEGGETKTLTQWAEHIGEDRAYVYDQYRKHSLPSDKILILNTRVVKDDLLMWNPSKKRGRTPKRIVKAIKVYGDNGRKEVVFKCDNDCIYEISDLAALVGLNVPQLRTRGYANGWTHPNLLGKIKPGCRLDGTKKTCGAKVNGGGNAEWGNFTNESRL